MITFLQSTLAYIGAMALEFIGISLLIILYQAYDQEKKEKRVIVPDGRFTVLTIFALMCIVGGFDLVRRFVV